jgi:hypothetical protein
MIHFHRTNEINCRECSLVSMARCKDKNLPPPRFNGIETSSWRQAAFVPTLAVNGNGTNISPVIAGKRDGNTPRREQFVPSTSPSPPPTGYPSVTHTTPTTGRSTPRSHGPAGPPLPPNSGLHSPRGPPPLLNPNGSSSTFVANGPALPLGSPTTHLGLSQHSYGAVQPPNGHTIASSSSSVPSSSASSASFVSSMASSNALPPSYASLGSGPGSNVNRQGHSKPPSVNSSPTMSTPVKSAAKLPPNNVPQSHPAPIRPSHATIEAHRLVSQCTEVSSVYL